jgi:predicted ATPase
MTATSLHSGRFHIRGELGGGGMGVVYEAEDALTQATVALKLLRHAEGEELYRFKHEFRQVASLRGHPNLVRLGELFCEEGQWFFTMELVRGTTFVEYVRVSDAARPFDEARLRSALEQLVEGLRALHRAGHVHCDIKPSNVLVSDEGRVVLLDFGLAMRVNRIGEDPETRPGMLGTAPYMAPEQPEANRIGPAVDLYATGVMLFEALTGALPFDGPPLQLMRDKQLQMPPAPRTIVPSVPADLDRLCLELLDRDPARRPTAAALCARLRGDVPVRAEDPASDADYGGEPHTPFIGRAGELSALEAAFAAVDRDGTASLLIAGEPGIGKTALAEEFLRRARAAAPSLLVLSGRCYEQEYVPFKAFDGIVDGISHYLKLLPPVEAAALLPSGIHILATLFPVLRRVPVIAMAVPLRRGVDNTSQMRARAFEDLKALLGAIADRTPLVLFFDDLQWLDADSLELLESLRRPPDSPRCLLLGTMRSTAPSAAEWASRLPSLFQTLSLGGLGPADSAALAAKLSEGALSAQETEALVDDSGGHPLYLSELLRAGHEPGLRLEELLARRIASLPPLDQHLLEAAAVAAVPLGQQVLADAAQVDPSVCAARLPALRNQRLIRILASADGEPLIALFHDRVREAVIGRLEADEAARARRVRVHRALGRALMPANEDEALDDDALFAIVHHLHSSAELIESASERHRLVALSLRAARQAKFATAYDTALGYVTAAEALLTGLDDQGAVRERFALCKARIELQYLIGQRESALRRFAATISEPHTADERTELYGLLIEMQTGRGQFAEATASARRGLRLFGVRLPAHPGRVAIVGELLRLRWRQGRRTLGQLAELDESHDERMRCAMQILMATAPAAYFSDRTLLSVIMLKMASLSMKYGVTAQSAYGFAGYGMILTGLLGQCHKGLAMGELGIRLDERLGSGELEAKLHHLAGAFLTPWVRPLDEALAHLKRAFEAGLKIGDIAYRTYAATGTSFISEPYKDIETIIHMLETAIDIARRNRDHDLVMLNRIRLRGYQRLRDTSPQPTSLADESYTEEELLAQLSDTETPMASAAFYGVKAQLCYHFGEYQAAWQYACEMEKREGAHFGFITLVNHTLIQVLIAARLASLPANDASARELKRAMRRGLGKLRAWAREVPDKFAPWSLLAEAEAARAAGRHAQAATAYEAALAAAKRSGVVRIEALARELWARQLQERKQAGAADTQLDEAITTYRRWGANAKANHLHEHPFR